MWRRWYLLGCFYIPSLCFASSYEVHSQGGIQIYDLKQEGYWFKLGGGLQFDAVMFDSTGADVAVYPNGMNIRRARLDLTGGVGKDWGYRLETDFGQASQDSVQILNAFIGYTGSERFYVALGQVAIPFGMENWMSPNHYFFMERSLMVGATDPEYGIGVYGDSHYRNVSLMGAIYAPREGTSQSGGSLTSGSDPYGISARMTWVPYQTETGRIHLGASALYQDTHLRTTQVMFSTPPEVVGRRTLVPYTTGTLSNTSDYQIYGFELAGQSHAYTWMAEYQRIHLDRNRAAAGGDVSFQGYTLTASYTLGGNGRFYDERSGTFGSVRALSYKPWELVARYSYLDLGDDNAAGQHVGAIGYIHNIGGGVNWWYSNHLRVSFNTIYSRQSTGIQLIILGLRAQLNWS